jgi:hypothetical protein
MELMVFHSIPWNFPLNFPSHGIPWQIPWIHGTIFVRVGYEDVKNSLQTIYCQWRRKLLLWENREKKRLRTHTRFLFF